MEGASVSAEPAGAESSGAGHTVRFVFVGDVMLARLVDQLFPQHVDEPEDRLHALGLLLRQGGQQALKEVAEKGHSYVWGDTLSLFDPGRSDLRVANLETAATHRSEKWPDKAFNYRMVAHIDHVSLANNHTLDYGVEGMRDTVAALDRHGISWAGVGESEEEAFRPAVIRGVGAAGVNVALFSMADHYSFWAAQPAGTSAAGGGGGGGCGKPGIAYVDVDGLNEAGRQHIKALLRAGLQAAGCDVELVVVSLHWGSNYCWSPAAEFTRFAHFLIDECGVDIIHGHSSHHVQGMELYRGRPVLYGCGDFLDDYAVHEEYRNDLSAVYEVEYDVEARRCVSLEVVPTACHMMRVSRQLAPGDRRWLCTTMQRLCRAFGTQLQVTPEGTLRAVLPVSGPPVSAASGGEDCTAADRGISKAGQRGGSAAVSGQQPVDTTSSGATAVSTSAPRGGG